MRFNARHRLTMLGLVPGLLLLFGVGYAGKLSEQWLKALGKAHGWALPNIEYVFWAILFGLVIGHTVGTRAWFRVFDAGIAAMGEGLWRSALAAAATV